MFSPATRNSRLAAVIDGDLRRPCRVAAIMKSSTLDRLSRYRKGRLEESLGQKWSMLLGVHLSGFALMKARTLIAVTLVFLCGCAQKPQAPLQSRAGPGVVFFDVGQGDAALLKTGEATVLIDTGRNGEIVSLLHEEGVTRIDVLILSHPHMDHVGGLSAVMKNVPVDQIWYAGAYHGRIAKLLDTAANAERVSSGKTKTIGRLSLLVLHPESGVTDTSGGDVAANNGSVVVRAVYGESRYLFPGDCELGCWEELFKLHRSDLRADVLKVAHHGSWNGTNSGVLGNVRPGTVIISCGRQNQYGHPHQIVLTMIQKLRAKMFRTDEQGSIHCKETTCVSETEIGASQVNSIKQ